MSDKIPNDESEVRHNVADHRYEIEIDGRLAVADYALENGLMVMTRTFVPPELRGRGLAEKLVRRALDDAKTAHVRIVPACSYVAAFLQRHREYQELLAR